jgi:hypothetical protein
LQCTLGQPDHRPELRVCVLPKVEEPGVLLDGLIALAEVLVHLGLPEVRRAGHDGPEAVADGLIPPKGLLMTPELAQQFGSKKTLLRLYERP